jgi:hypothetical protein
MSFWTIKKITIIFKADNEHKDNLRQQRLGFIFKQLIELNITNATKKRL